MDNNARCIIQLRLNHTMATNNSKILVNYNNKGLFCLWCAPCQGKFIAHSQKKGKYGADMQWLFCFFLEMVHRTSTYILLVKASHMAKLEL